MSVRVQVILDEEEAGQFRSQAKRESKSLSAWLRDAGKEALKTNRSGQLLTDPDSLQRFFQECDRGEQEREPDWEEHKRLIIEGYQGRGRT